MELHTKRPPFRADGLTERQPHATGIRHRFARILAHLRHRTIARFAVVNDGVGPSDPLDHPVLKAMSAQELADIPFSHVAMCAGRPTGTGPAR